MLISAQKLANHLRHVVPRQQLSAGDTCATEHSWNLVDRSQVRADNKFIDMATHSSLGPLVIALAALVASLHVGCSDDDIIITSPSLGGTFGATGGSSGTGGAGGSGQGGSGVVGGSGGGELDAGDAGDGLDGGGVTDADVVDGSPEAGVSAGGSGGSDQGGVGGVGGTAAEEPDAGGSGDAPDASGVDSGADAATSEE